MPANVLSSSEQLIDALIANDGAIHTEGHMTNNKPECPPCGLKHLAHGLVAPMEMGNMNVPFKRPLLLIALATLIFAATPSRADDFDLTVGRLSTENNFVGTQVTVAVKNNTAEILKVGTIECVTCYFPRRSGSWTFTPVRLGM